MKQFNLIISLVIVALSVVLCGRFISHSFANQRDKADRAALNHVKYGLFSVDEWKNQISAILAGQINSFSIRKNTQRELRKRLEGMLSILIDKVYERIKQGNGKFKQSVMNMFVDVNDVKKGIPEYVDALMRELMHAKTKSQFKTVLNEQLERYIDDTFDETDTAQVDEIVRRTGAEDAESARAVLERDIFSRQTRIRNEAILLALLPLVLFSWAFLNKRTLKLPQYLLLLVCLAVLLAAGVSTPMIDMEAKISRMGFVLLGHTIQFENQVLYYQSKSILDVFWILITDEDIAMKFVGVLLVTFSVLFPLLKLGSLPAYYYDYRGARSSPVVRFFAVKSAKWSMADVMVLAIFMAYIGFNGVITSQFKQLSTASQGLELLTTNGTSLQPGYYLFLVFILLGMVFSGVLTGEIGKRAEGDSIRTVDSAV